MSETYRGPVVFVHPHDENGWLVGDGTQGVHYAVGEDGHADKSRPLRANGKGGWRDAKPGEAPHHETHHQNYVELEFPGQEPLRVTEDEAAKVRELLDEMRKGAE